jgi:hypothetical protein
MDSMGYAKAFDELSQNNQYGVGSGLSRYTVENLVTPSLTGLRNEEAMRAAYDLGYPAGGERCAQRLPGNPTPNAGYYNALAPGPAPGPSSSDGSLFQRARSRRSGSPNTRCCMRRPA